MKISCFGAKGNVRVDGGAKNLRGEIARRGRRRASANLSERSGIVPVFGIDGIVPRCLLERLDFMREDAARAEHQDRYGTHSCVGCASKRAGRVGEDVDPQSCDGVDEL